MEKNNGPLSAIGNQTAPFTLAPLPYAANSLEKAIDEETMKIHHGKHHKAYVDNVNNALGAEKPRLIDLLTSISKQSTAIRNNAGGHWNHTFFWTCMSGNDADNVIPDDLKKEIETTWGSLDTFKAEFDKAGMSRFGSGWAWLIRTPKGLQVTSTPNQDNPLMDDIKEKGFPILGADVWEHAYYLRYQNMRAEYLKNFWKVVNWKMVKQYSDEAKSSFH